MADLTPKKLTDILPVESMTDDTLLAVQQEGSWKKATVKQVNALKKTLAPWQPAVIGDAPIVTLDQLVDIGGGLDGISFDDTSITAPMGHMGLALSNALPTPLVGKLGIWTTHSDADIEAAYYIYSGFLTQDDLSFEGSPSLMLGVVNYELGEGLVYSDDYENYENYQYIADWNPVVDSVAVVFDADNRTLSYYTNRDNQTPILTFDLVALGITAVPEFVMLGSMGGTASGGKTFDIDGVQSVFGGAQVIDLTPPADAANNAFILDVADSVFIPELGKDIESGDIVFFDGNSVPLRVIQKDVEIPAPDLTDYYTKEEVDNLLPDAEVQIIFTDLGYSDEGYVHFTALPPKTLNTYFSLQTPTPVTDKHFYKYEEFEGTYWTADLTVTTGDLLNWVDDSDGDGTTFKLVKTNAIDIEGILANKGYLTVSEAETYYTKKETASELKTSTINNTIQGWAKSSEQEKIKSAIIEKVVSSVSSGTYETTSGGFLIFDDGIYDTSGYKVSSKYWEGSAVQYVDTRIYPVENKNILLSSVGKIYCDGIEQTALPEMNPSKTFVGYDLEGNSSTYMNSGAIVAGFTAGGIFMFASVNWGNWFISYPESVPSDATKFGGIQGYSTALGRTAVVLWYEKNTNTYISKALFGRRDFFLSEQWFGSTYAAEGGVDGGFIGSRYTEDFTNWLNKSNSFNFNNAKFKVGSDKILHESNNSLRVFLSPTSSGIDVGYMYGSIPVDPSTIYHNNDLYKIRLVNVIEANQAPSTLTSSGAAGQLAYDSDYLYVCYAENSWISIPKKEFLDSKVDKSEVPASATSVGKKGQVAHDNDYFYVCVATDTWKRAALETWS